MKTNWKHLLLLCALLLLLPAAARAAGGSGAYAVEVDSIEIAAPESSILEPGGKLDLRASVLPADATERSLKWTVTGSNSGWSEPAAGTCRVVAGTTPGTISIRAEAQDGSGVKSNTITLEVSGLVLDKKTLTLDTGQSQGLSVTLYGNARKNTVKWESEDTSVAMVSGTGVVSGSMTAGSTRIVCSAGSYTAYCTVTTRTSNAETITKKLTDGRLEFSDLVSSLRSACTETTGKSLVYLSSLSVPAGQGTLYYQYVSEADTGSGVASAGRYYYSPGAGQYSLQSITFVPKAGFSGVAVISYKGFTASSSYAGEICVTVNAGQMVFYVSNSGEAVAFSGADFSSCCEYLNNRPLSYVTFTLPSARYGCLYRNYYGGEIYGSNVTETDRYFRTGTPSIDSLSFIPAESFTGTAEIAFRGYDITGATFRGTVTIRVTSSAGTSIAGDVNYTTSPGRRVDFLARDFDDACDNVLETTLNYIRFTELPDPARGTLYYDTNETVFTSSRYYRTGYKTDTIGNLSFLPESGFTGTVTIPFKGYDMYAEAFDGMLVITVEEGQGGVITYSVDAGGRVYFEKEDFSEASYKATNRQLNYIRFTTLPNSYRGTLYYSSSTQVTTGTNYYYSGSSSRLISSLSFVADRDYKGAVSIPFTGYSTNGGSFDGTIEINVQGTVGYTVIYSHTTYGSAVFLDPLEITSNSDSSQSALISTVRFTLPDKNAGTLYRSYTSPVRSTALTSYDTLPIASLAQVAFVPKAGYSGTVYIPYTATDINGGTVTGTLRVQAQVPTSSAYFSDMSASAWAVQSVDFLREYGVVQGTSSGLYSPSGAMTRGSFILMLSRAFAFSAAGTYSYPDVPQTSVYAAAIAGAKSLGVVTADENGNFRPRETITRQDAALYLYRCMLLYSKISVGASLSALNYYQDAAQISSECKDAMAALVQAGVFYGNNGYLLPLERLNRAQMAAILHRALT